VNEAVSKYIVKSLTYICIIAVTFLVGTGFYVIEHTDFMLSGMSRL